MDMSFLMVAFYASISPCLIMLVNYIFIPTIVEMLSHHEGYKLKSRRHKMNLFKQFLIITIASIFIPVTTNDGQISSFINYMAEKDIGKFQMEMATNFMGMSDYFLKYLIQCTFLTNIIAFLDIPHKLYMFFKNRFRKYDEDIPDDWYFDLGYQYAFSISVFLMTLIFVASAPHMSIFGCLFFVNKYLVDKYNLTVMYKNEFESQGELASSVNSYIAFSIFIF